MYSRQLEEKTLTLAASGWTYDKTFVLVDRETGSLWYPLPSTPGLTCISGVHADRRLAELSSSLAPWNEWSAVHPASGYLANPGVATMRSGIPF